MGFFLESKNTHTFIRSSRPPWDHTDTSFPPTLWCSSSIHVPFCAKYFTSGWLFHGCFMDSSLDVSEAVRASLSTSLSPQAHLKHCVQNSNSSHDRWDDQSWRLGDRAFFFYSFFYLFIVLRLPLLISFFFCFLCRHFGSPRSHSLSLLKPILNTVSKIATPDEMISRRLGAISFLTIVMGSGWFSLSPRDLRQKIISSNSRLARCDSSESWLTRRCTTWLAVCVSTSLIPLRPD